MTLRRAIACCLTTAAILFAVFAPPHARAEAMGIALEGFPYPYPVHFMPLTLEGEDLRLAYMDVAPVGPSNGRTVVLLHGRNFPSSYWEPTIKALTEAGYRVVAPDQIGFGNSSKPTFAYSFDAMARATIALIDSLHVDRFDLVGHSMGGMLAVRLARAYGARIDHLVLYSPIGLEDYRFYVPPVTDEELSSHERELTADGYRKQLMTNYALSLPSSAIEPFVQLREEIRQSGEYERWLKSFVNSYQMIYSQPVAHEIPAYRSADPVHHGRERPQCAGEAVRAAGIAREDGAERGSRANVGGAHGERESQGFRGRRPSRASRSDAAVQRGRSWAFSSHSRGCAARFGALRLTAGARACDIGRAGQFGAVQGGDMPASTERRAAGPLG